MPGSRVDTLLAAARARIEPRVHPAHLTELTGEELAVIDIRPAEQRARDGDLPGATVIDRNVLEWRLDPTSPHRMPGAVPGQKVILICDEGFQSSLAAASLRDLGVDATDVVGGFQGWLAWRSAATIHAAGAGMSNTAD